MSNLTIKSVTMDEIKKEITSLNLKLKYFYSYDDIENCRTIRCKITELQKLLNDEPAGRNPNQ